MSAARSEDPYIPAPGLRLEVRQAAGDEVVVDLDGYLDVSTVGQLDELFDGPGADCRTLTLDLSCVGFIDSMGIGALMRARRRFDGEGRTLRLVNPSARALYTFDLTGLGDLVS